MNPNENTGFFAAARGELEKIRALPQGKRWEYIWEYYRLTVFIVAFAVFFCCMIGTFLVNSIRSTLFPKDSFSIAFACTDFADDPQWMENCLSSIGYDRQQEDFRQLTTSPLNDTTDDFRISVSVWLASGQPDLFVTDEASTQYLMELEALADLTEALPAELQQLAAGRMVDPWRLDITDTVFAEAYSLTDDAPVYLCMYRHGVGFARALDMLEYILTE